MTGVPGTRDRGPGCSETALCGSERASGGDPRRVTDPRVAARFWRHVDKAGPLPLLDPEMGSCWMWTASPNVRVPVFTVHGRAVSAARYSYELLVGPIPAGFDVVRLCFHIRCVRPDHIEAVTPEEGARLRGEHVRRKRRMPPQWLIERAETKRSDTI